jgi:hypothetical protein
MAVRRQMDVHRDVASLLKLVQEIAGEPEGLTRDRWLGLWEDPSGIERQVAVSQWDETYGHGGDSLDPALPRDDLARLLAAYEEAEAFVDRHVAHSEHRAEAVDPSEMLPMKAIHEPIDVIGEVFARYSSLLTGSGWASLTPAIQHDWKAAFKVPWIKPGARRRA